MATSRKRKDATAAEREIAAGRKQQEAIRTVLATLEGNGRYMDREAFEADVKQAAKRTGLKIPGTDQEGDLRGSRRARPGRRDLPRQQGTTGA